MKVIPVTCTWWRLPYSNVSLTEGWHYSNVPDEGYSTNLSCVRTVMKVITSNVPDEGYYSNVPDEGYY